MCICESVFINISDCTWAMRAHFRLNVTVVVTTFFVADKNFDLTPRDEKSYFLFLRHLGRWGQSAQI